MTFSAFVFFVSLWLIPLLSCGGGGGGAGGVAPPPPDPCSGKNWSVSVNAPAACPFEARTLTAVVGGADAVGPFSYAWSPGGAKTASITVGGGSGSYTVTVTDADDDCAKSAKGSANACAGVCLSYASDGPPGCAPCVDIALDPASACNTVILKIMVKGVSNIHGAAFDVQFDSSKLYFQGYATGALLEKSGQSVAYAAKVGSGLTDIVTVGAAILDGASEVSAAAGGEHLITLRFGTLAPGNAVFTFRNDPPYGSTLKNSGGGTITATWWGGMLGIS